MFLTVFLGFIPFFIFQELNFLMASEQRSLREKGTVGAKKIQRDLEMEARSCLDVLNKGHTSSGIYTLQMDTGLCR